MKACISTFCTWKSYGSMLQALGLKQALHSLGCDSFLVQAHPDAEYRLSVPRSAKELAYLPFHVKNKSNRQRLCQKGRDFIQQYLDIEAYPSYESLCSHPPQADIYIAGSDQVWQPHQMNPLFFLRFVSGVKKISYAASMGSVAAEEQTRQLFRQYISDFYRISVREQACAAFLAELTGQMPPVHIDPTFFMNAGEWRQYETAYPVKEPYILMFTIYWNPAVNDSIKQLSRQTGLPVYTVKTDKTRAFAHRSLYDVGPSEFLWLIDHAAYVVTSSFHGAAFSAVFHKPFSAVANPAAPSRIEQLLHTLQIPQVPIEQLGSHAPFDYDAIEKRMAAERERGLAYLKEALV